MISEVNCVCLTDEQLETLRSALYDMRDVPCLAELLKQLDEFFEDDTNEEDTDDERMPDA